MRRRRVFLPISTGGNNWAVVNGSIVDGAGIPTKMRGNDG
jgi:hypothetical protein